MVMQVFSRKYTSEKKKKKKVNWEGSFPTLLCLASGVRTRQTTTETMVSCRGIYSTSLAGTGWEMKGEMVGNSEREIWCYQQKTVIT